MRTGSKTSNGENGENDEYLLWEAPFSPDSPYEQPQKPVPAATHERSPVGMMPMQPMPANVLSPDDMLRAYAARSPAVSNGPSLARPPAANYNGNGARTLYTSPGSVTGGPKGENVMGGVGLGGKNRHSVGNYNEHDAYIGTAQ